MSKISLRVLREIIYVFQSEIDRQTQFRENNKKLLEKCDLLQELNQNGIEHFKNVIDDIKEIIKEVEIKGLREIEIR